MIPSRVFREGQSLLNYNAKSAGKYEHDIGRLICASQQLASRMISTTKQTDRDEFPEDRKSVRAGSCFWLFRPLRNFEFTKIFVTPFLSLGLII